MKTQDYVIIGGIGLGALYLMGKSSGMMKTISDDISNAVAKGAQAAAVAGAKTTAAAVAGAGVGAVQGVASVIPASNQNGAETGVSNWVIPISGGYQKGNAASLILGNLNNPGLLYNMLPILPDYTGGDLIPGLHLWG